MLYSLALLTLSPSSSIGDTGIRLNQLGYLIDDAKIAVIASSEPIIDPIFQIVEQEKMVFQASLSSDKGIYLAHAHHYLADFSSFKKNGNYRLQIGNRVSDDFEVGDNLYRNLPDSLLRFFQVQRCGSTSPLLHDPCHLKDIINVKTGDTTRSGVDLTGGWHDAGDYIKFTLTTAYSTHLLLLTYQMFPSIFNKWNFFEQPAPLTEARIGLDWLMKAHVSPDRLISQVQNVSDHNVGWRLPEADVLADKRIGWEYPSKATAGSAAAALALGADIFTRQGDKQYAQSCLKHAIELFALTQSQALPNQDCRPDSHYFDNDPRDNIALAAIELYRTTGEIQYLKISKQLTDTLGAGGWVSWGDMQGLAAFRLAEFYPAARDYLQIALLEYQSNGAKNPYCYPFSTYPWGSSSLQTGVGILAVAFELAGGGSGFRSLAIRQRDAILGANPFGISYFSGVGNHFAKNFHNQVSYIRKVTLPGAIAEGPISRKDFESSGIHLELPDEMRALQSELAVYHDDRMDYLTNEPTISGNAQAYFLISWFAAKKKLPK